MTTWYRENNNGEIEEVQITESGNGMVTVRTMSDSGITIARHRGAYQQRGLHRTRAQCLAARRNYLRQRVQYAQRDVKNAQRELLEAKRKLASARS